MISYDLFPLYSLVDCWSKSRSLIVVAVWSKNLEIWGVFLPASNCWESFYSEFKSIEFRLDTDFPNLD